MKFANLINRVSVLVALSGLLAGAVHAAALPTSGLQADFDSTVGVGTSGSNVAQWDDQAGLPNNAVQAVSNATIGTATVGYNVSMPVLNFAGSTALTFTLPSANTYAGVTVFIVGNTGTVGGNETVLSTGGSSGSGGVRWAFGMGSASDGYGWAGSGAGVSLGSGTTIQANTWHLLSYAYDKTAWDVDNLSPALISVSAPSDTSFFGGNWNGVIGTENAAPASAGSYSFEGQIARILIYDHKLSPADYADAVTYLNERYFVENVIPEPSTALLLVSAAGLLLRSRRRR